MTIVSFSDALARRLPIVEPTGDWPAQIAHLSPSSIKKFLTCPDQWRKHYLLRQRERDGYWLFQGSVNHAAVDWALRRKMSKGVMPSASDVLDVLDDKWSEELDKRGGAGEILWDDTTPARVKDEVAACVKAYLPVAATLNPIAFEQKFSLDVPGVPVPTIGYIDLEDENVVIDRKDSAKKASSPKPDWVMQGGLYSAVKNKPVHFHVTAKNKTPIVFTPAEEPGLAQAAWPLARAQAYIAQVAHNIMTLYSSRGPDEVWPGATMHPFACNYCGHRPNCAWWN